MIEAFLVGFGIGSAVTTIAIVITVLGSDYSAKQ